MDFDSLTLQRWQRSLGPNEDTDAEDRPITQKERRASAQGAYMRRILIALVLGGILISVMASPNKTVTRTETDVTNNQIYSGMTGLHVSLPSDIKNFPVELVPLP